MTKVDWTELRTLICHSMSVAEKAMHLKGQSLRDVQAYQRCFLLEIELDIFNFYDLDLDALFDE